MLRRKLIGWLVFFNLLALEPLHAESFFAIGGGFSNFSYESKEKANTPNISGMQLELGTGYTLGSVFDFGLRGDYMYGSAGTTHLAKKEVTLLNYG